MKYNRLIFSTITCFFTLFACTEAPKEQQNVTEQRDDNVIMIPTEGGGQIPVDLDTFNQAPRDITSKSEKTAQSITVEPKHQVGLITADMTEEDIKKLYGNRRSCVWIEAMSRPLCFPIRIKNWKSLGKKDMILKN